MCLGGGGSSSELAHALAHLSGAYIVIISGAAWLQVMKILWGKVSLRTRTVWVSCLIPTEYSCVCVCWEGGGCSSGLCQGTDEESIGGSTLLLL